MRYFFSFAAACLMLACLMASPSCKSRDEGYDQALVIATDDLTPTGCGYLLRFGNGEMVKPQYVPSAYQFDSLPVLVKYTNTGTETNCRPQNPMDIVVIDDIRRE
jgi:hypothetical protein